MITRSLKNYTRPSGILMDGAFDNIVDMAYNLKAAEVR